MPEFARGRLEHSKNFILAANVRLDRDRSPAARLNLPNHLFAPGSLRQKIHSDRETVSTNQPRNGGSDSPARASDNHSSTVLLAPRLMLRYFVLNRRVIHRCHSSPTNTPAP